jgi:hypothetical protein
MVILLLVGRVIVTMRGAFGSALAFRLRMQLGVPRAVAMFGLAGGLRRGFLLLRRLAGEVLAFGIDALRGLTVGAHGVRHAHAAALDTQHRALCAAHST